MIWDTLAFNPDDMRYSCSGVACLQRYYREEKKLSISRDFAESAFSDSTLKKWSVVSGKMMLRVKIADKLYPRKSGSRSSESGASSVFEQAILLGI
ncbi:hypothetical protein ACFX15_017660 [Malus domestica]